MQQVLEHAQQDYRRVLCPIHQTPLRVTQTLGTRRGTTGHQLHVFHGPLPDSTWTAVRGTLRCDTCSISADLDFTDWPAT